MEWIAIAKCHDEIEADIIAGKLNLEGIHTRKDSSSLGAIYPGTILAGPITVFVQKKDLEIAEEILAPPQEGDE